MNRAFTLVAAQSAIAAAILAIAPLASAAAAYNHDAFDPNAGPFVSSASRADVRQGAIAAARARSAYLEAGPSVAAPFVSTVSRAQVHAEAVAAVRDGLLPGYEGHIQAPRVSSATVRMAGLGR